LQRIPLFWRAIIAWTWQFLPSKPAIFSLGMDYATQ